MHSDNVSTSAAESRDRKTTKPIMEKRRRARINASLAELKSLLLDVIKREGARHSKMEKADILEMTVKHLRDMQTQSITGAPPNDPTVSDKHRLGFSECAQEVSRYLSNIDGCDAELRTRLLDHLANFVSGLQHSTLSSPPVTSHPVTPTPPDSSFSVPSTSRIAPTSNQRPNILPSSQPIIFPSDTNNNIAILSASQPVQPTNLVSGLQVIPAKLQTGEIAFVLPGTSPGTNQIPNYIIPVYTSPSATSLKSSATITSGATSTGSYMTVVPSGDLFQTCTQSPKNSNITSQAMSSPSSSMSPSSTSTSSVLSLSSPGHHTDSSVLCTRVCNLVQQNQDMFQRNVGTYAGLRHEDVRDSSEIRKRGAIRRHDGGSLFQKRDPVDNDGMCGARSGEGTRHGNVLSSGVSRYHDEIAVGDERRHSPFEVGLMHHSGAMSEGDVRQDDPREFNDGRSQVQRSVTDMRHSEVRGLGAVLHQGSESGGIHHPSVRDLGEVCHQDRGLGEVRHQDRGLGELRHQERGLGEVRHQDRGLGEVRHQDRGLGEVRHQDRGLGEVRHQDRGFGEVHHQDRGLGEGNQEDRGLGEVRHQDRGLGEGNQEDRGLGEVRHQDRGLGEVRHQDRGLGEVRHQDRGLGEVRHQDRGLGEGNQEDRGLGEGNQEDVRGTAEADHQGAVDLRRHADERDVGPSRQEEMNTAVWRPW